MFFFPLKKTTFASIMTQNELILLATVALLSVILILTRRIEAEKCKKKVAEMTEALEAARESAATND